MSTAMEETITTGTGVVVSVSEAEHRARAARQDIGEFVTLLEELVVSHGMPDGVGGERAMTLFRAIARQAKGGYEAARRHHYRLDDILSNDLSDDCITLAGLFAAIHAAATLCVNGSPWSRESALALRYVGASDEEEPDVRAYDWSIHSCVSLAAQCFGEIQWEEAAAAAARELISRR